MLLATITYCIQITLVFTLMYRYFIKTVHPVVFACMFPFMFNPIEHVFSLVNGAIQLFSEIIKPKVLIEFIDHNSPSEKLSEMDDTSSLIDVFSGIMQRMYEIILSAKKPANQGTDLLASNPETTTVASQITISNSTLQMERGQHITTVIAHTISSEIQNQTTNPVIERIDRLLTPIEKFYWTVNNGAAKSVSHTIFFIISFTPFHNPIRKLITGKNDQTADLSQPAVPTTESTSSSLEQEPTGATEDELNIKETLVYKTMDQLLTPIEQTYWKVNDAAAMVVGGTVRYMFSFVPFVGKRQVKRKSRQGNIIVAATSSPQPRRREASRQMNSA